MPQNDSQLPTRHKWVSVYHWFEEQILDEENINLSFRGDIVNLLRNVDPDVIETYYGSQMQEEGYYEEYIEEPATGEMYRCPECGKPILLEEAAYCHECKEVYHQDMECLDIDEEYKDPVCYYCTEIEESLHV